MSGIGAKLPGLALLGFLAIASFAYGAANTSVGSTLLGVLFVAGVIWYWFSKPPR